MTHPPTDAHLDAVNKALFAEVNTFSPAAYVLDLRARLECARELSEEVHRLRGIVADFQTKHAHSLRETVRDQAEEIERLRHANERVKFLETLCRKHVPEWGSE
jgi:DNA repair ATPase RecN